MGTIKKSPFKLSQFLIAEFSIKREPLKKGKIEFQINPSGLINRKEKIFLLQLDVNIKDDTGSFVIQMACNGYFTFKNSESPDTLSNYFYTNAPAIIYPYIRSYVTAITALTGLEAVYLPVMNLAGLKDQLMQNIVEA